MITKKLNTPTSEMTAKIFGSYDKNILKLEEAFGVRIYNIQNQADDGDTIVVEGEPEEVVKAHEALAYMKKIAAIGDELTEQSVDYTISMVKDGRLSELDDLDNDCFFVTAKGKPVKAKTVGQ